MALARVCRRGIKARAYPRPHPKECEDVRGGACAFDPFGLGPAREIEVCVLESADCFELSRLPDPLEKVGVRGRHSVTDWRTERRIFLPNHHNLLRIAEREGSKQDSVDHTKDRCVGANSQSQDRNNGEGESRRFAQHAKTESEVRQEISHRPRLTSWVKESRAVRSQCLLAVVVPLCRGASVERRICRALTRALHGSATASQAPDYLTISCAQYETVTAQTGNVSPILAIPGRPLFFAGWHLPRFA